MCAGDIRREYLVTFLVLLLAGCADKRTDQALANLNWDIVRLTRENETLKVRMTNAEAETAKLHADVTALRSAVPAGKIVTATQPSPAPNTTTASTPTTAAAPAPDRQQLDAAVHALVTAVNSPGGNPRGPHVTSIGSESRTASSDSVISAKCAKEWGTDFRMRQYCEDQQRTAQANLAVRTAANSGINMSDFDAIRLHCQREWNGDYRMQEYCEDQQIAAWKKMRR